ncbi:MAG: RHS repeat-associated core domain-containing protein [Terriglobales bacterium]
MHGQAQYNSYFPLPGGAKAYELSGAWLEVHGDWLASARLTTNPGSLYRALSYAPYGEMYADSAPGAASQWFTGVDSDVRTDLSDFPFREYSSIQGRWLSPDPAGLAAVNPANPQTWNAYAYVANQPLEYTDPLGLDGSGGGQTIGGGNPLTPAAQCETEGLPEDCWWLPLLDDLCGSGSPWEQLDPSCRKFATPAPSEGGGAIAPETVPITGKLQIQGPACQLAAPGGSYDVGPNAVALFQPPMAAALTNAFKLLNSQQIRPVIDSGYRSPADQTRMRNGASGPNPAAVVSWHEAGMAVDIDGTASSYFPTIVRAMEAQGLTWGGTFAPRDPPHFQLAHAGTQPSAAMVASCAAAAGGHQ